MAAATHQDWVRGSPGWTATTAWAQTLAPGAKGARPLARLASAEPSASTSAARHPSTASPTAGR
eukprot:15476973-Alexandrium_andersonii.AAC.1